MKHVFACLAVAWSLSSGSYGAMTSAIAATDGPASLAPILEELRSADGVVLMIVPFPVETPIALDRTTLGQVACQYAIDGAAALEDVAKVLKDDILEVEPNPRPKGGYRIGILFRANGKALREFYFNDSGGSFNLVGISRDYGMKARASLPNKLRALAVRPGTVLVRDHYSRCPHA